MSDTEQARLPILSDEDLREAEEVIKVPLPDDLNEVQTRYIEMALSPRAREVRRSLPGPSLRALDMYALHGRCTPMSFIGLLIREASWNDVLAKADHQNKRCLTDWGFYVYNFVPSGMRRFDSWKQRLREERQDAEE